MRADHVKSDEMLTAARGCRMTCRVLRAQLSQLLHLQLEEMVLLCLLQLDE